jgi:diguanylate cyclase (GGDEF)-like protein
VGHMPAIAPGGRPTFRSSADHREGYVSLSAPIRDGDGTQLGWMSEELALSGISPQLEQPYHRFTGATTVVTRAGDVLMTAGISSTSARVQSPVVLRLLARGRTAAATYHSPFVDADRIIAVAPVAGTDLMVLVGADAAAATRPATALAARLVLAFLVTASVVGLLVFLGFLVLRRSRRTLEREKDLATTLAHTDPLTGVANRRAFDTALTRLVQSGQRTGLVLVDLDGLKTVNDTCGHAAGDEALRRTATAIRSVVRPDDLVARIGGDEFVILLREDQASRAEDVAARARAAIAAVDLDGHGHLSATTGTDVATGAELTTALRRADASMYKAKHARR